MYTNKMKGSKSKKKVIYLPLFSYQKYNQAIVIYKN